MVALSPNCWSDKVCQDPGNSNLSEISQWFTSQHKDSALPNCLQIPLLETSGQTTIKTETQSYLSKKNEGMKVYVTDGGAR